MTAEQFAEAEKVLAASDPKLDSLIARQKIKLQNRPSDYFAALCRSIIGQQVSVAAASTIFERFKAATSLKPATTVSLSEEQLKAIGLSRQKTAYICDLAQKFHDNPAVYEHLERQTDEQIIDELTKVKGIGVWTAQMFLMFTLERPDVFAPDDVGLQRAMQLLYNWDKLPPRAELELQSEKWRPYRTIACMHLWHSLNNNPD